MKTSILMVCLGNICRSPLAEGILKNKLPLDRFKVDSAGTAGFHIGRSPDHRSIEVAAQNGIDISRQKARKFTPNDFKEFNKIYVMDHANLANVLQMASTPEDRNKVALLLETDEVPDPYYENEEGFKTVFRLIDQACNRLSNKLQNL
ncbi:MAG: low molecular weight phosphotyrosine protein phosphatase [Flavobacteriaceae bacterium]|nr:low molecular weight phosphotyrosine protein phosphatase [Flavobacteriaceae bacterium]